METIRQGVGEEIVQFARFDVENCEHTISRSRYQQRSIGIKFNRSACGFVNTVSCDN